MTPRIWLRLAELLIFVLLAVTLVVSWRADRRDRAQLATQLAAEQQTISEAAAHQKDRDAALTQTLAQIARLKQDAVTPAQILKALPQALALPQPITLQAPGATGTAGPRLSASPTDPGDRASPSCPHENPHCHPERSEGSRLAYSPLQSTTNTAQPPTSESANLPNNPVPQPNSTPDAVIPAADLKPLYDFALDCQACRAKLATAQSDLADEKTKSDAVVKERDAALRIAKGGSALRRIARAAKWFLLGAAAGALAAKARP